jgi:drug/metabolite transporter (DMT)-like permease
MGQVPAIHRPPPSDLLLIVVGVLGVSTSGPIIAALAAPALAIAFWRNAFGTAALVPYALARHRHELRFLRGRSLWLTLAAGVLLAAHFALWVPSLAFTSVASSTALVCMQAVWAALFSRLVGQSLPKAAWVGMLLAIVGVLLVTGVDFSLSPRALVGDVMALLGGVFSGAYVVVGGQVRRTVSTTAYTVVCYGLCALLLLLACLIAGQPLTGYSARDWLLLLALTVFAQLLGHSVLNLVLRSTSATVVSLAILFEVPGAALLAAWWLGQTPPLAALPALVLMLVGIAIVIRAGARETAPTLLPE